MLKRILELRMNISTNISIVNLTSSLIGSFWKRKRSLRISNRNRRNWRKTFCITRLLIKTKIKSNSWWISKDVKAAAVRNLIPVSHKIAGIGSLSLKLVQTKTNLLKTSRFLSYKRKKRWKMKNQIVNKNLFVTFA